MDALKDVLLRVQSGEQSFKPLPTAVNNFSRHPSWLRLAKHARGSRSTWRNSSFPFSQPSSPQSSLRLGVSNESAV